MFSDTSPNPLVHSFELVLESRLGGIVINFVLIPLLVLSAILLPPISLADRVLSIGYDRIGREGGVIQDPDGTQITFLPEGMKRSVRVKLSAMPRSLFLEGSAGNSLLSAAESIPPNLVMKSPYYRIQHKGGIPEAVVLTIPIPNEAEPYSTLDLYAWNGETWEWLPNRKLLSEDVLESQLDYLPDSVVVMQTHAINPNVSTDYSPDKPLPEDVRDTLVEINPQGLYLDSDGQIVGDVGALPPEIQNAAFNVVPTLRNWGDDGSVRSDLIDNLLIDPTAQQRHVQEIVDLVQRNAYQGIDIDYRGINPDLREEYTAFLNEINDALPDNKQLSVRVELPQQVSADTWDTGAYDWQAIGRIADVVKVPTSPDPKTYRPGGQMEAMLDWAVGQVDRYKLQLLLNTSSTEQVNGITRPISYKQALNPIGAVTVLGGGSSVVEPGQEVDFTLQGLQASTGIQFDSASGTYWFAYLDQQNVQRTVYLENAASIARKLQFVAQYNLRGIAVQNLLSENNDAQIWNVVRKFLDLVIPPVESQYSVVWRVQNEDGGLIAEQVVDLSNPVYKWTAPEAGGSYEVEAAISSSQDTSGAIPRGSVAVLVATLTPTPSPTPEMTPTPEATSTPESEPTGEPAQVAAAQSAPAQAAPPPSAPANVPFGYGIQVDPRGNTSANIGHVRALGFNWVKFQMPWKDVEPAPGGYSWGMWDELISAYSANDIKILLSIPKAPAWARPTGACGEAAEGLPIDPAKYAEFVGLVADRYRGKVQMIEIWNEQNLWYEAGGYGCMDPAFYVKMLQLSYQAIKLVNQEIAVISSALTPAGNVGNAAIDDFDYLNAMYAHGAKGYFDALGAHPSGFMCPALADWRTVTPEEAGGDPGHGTFTNRHHSWCFHGTMEGYRNIMVANGDGNKAIVPTEFGWAVTSNPQPGYEYATSNTEEERARWTVEAYQWAKQQGWAGPMFLWNLDYGVTAPNTELANFGILNTPVYNALLTMPK